MSENTPRPSQVEILRYRGGKMGISAVPGSGKTYTLSTLAADIITRGELADDQEVLIVTLVNSAVDNFSSRIAGMIGKKQFFPNLGYRVRTLHGLANDIVRGRPALVNLEENFQILDERDTERIREEAATAWLRANPHALDEYLKPELDDNQQANIRREKLPELVKSIALSFIRTAKDMQLTPGEVRERLDILEIPLPLAQMGAAIYRDYQRALDYRGAVDFDDLIRLALKALKNDERYLQRLRYNWPYILEDEAQDSSELQQNILGLLAGPEGNWVRVGDPNQAIYETFTTAKPTFLINFTKREDVMGRELPESGRSMQSIIDVANELIRWTTTHHPVEAVRSALTDPYIQPTPPGDPQPNPPDNPQMIHLYSKRLTAEEELKVVADSLERWLPLHKEETAAVLTPRNQRGVELVNELKRRGIPFVENLKSTESTRLAAGALGNILRYLSAPQDSKRLATAYEVWRRESKEDQALQEKVNEVAGLLRKCRNVEDYLWPRPDCDWLEEVATVADEEFIEELGQFREKVQRWHGAALLPIDQAILTLAQDIFNEPVDLAVAHKLAVVLRQSGETNPDWRLPQLTDEMVAVAKNQRRFLGLSDDDRAFDPEQHKGKVVVTTIHKAKGLEWNRVYLMSVNNYDFPSGEIGDRYISEKWFLRDQLNLEAETLEQLAIAFTNNSYEWYEEGRATQAARLDYVRERLRLLYVGITRAKNELIITWNSGRDKEQRMARGFAALIDYWTSQRIPTGLEDEGTRREDGSTGRIPVQ